MAYIKKIWKDYPNTTTQIKAEDLNNIENGIDDVDSRLVTVESDIDTAETNITNLQNVTKYITATAGSNGDFYVNLGITPYTGMIVYVSFPSATTGTSNARLSINNGTNYKNIKTKSGNSILAWILGNKYEALYYNGTDFINMNLIKRTLWTNPNPNASFAASNNIIAVAGYTDLIFDMIASTTDTGTHYLVHKINDNFTTRDACKTWNSNYGNILSSRDLYINNGYAACGQGYYYGIGSSSNEGQNDAMSIPYRIYGILE